MNMPAKRDELPTPSTIEEVLMRGNLEDLTPQQRVEHLAAVCASLGLNPLTRPFEYLKLSGRLQLYAKRAATDQLRKINGISVAIVDYDVDGGLLTVTARATDKTGRTDEDYGVVPFKGGANEIAANAKMKAATKAKRRVTLAISGLGFLDESELPGQQRPQTISKTQREELLARAAAVDADMPSYLDFLGERWDLAIGKVHDIPASHFEDAMAQLNRKAAAYEKAQQKKLEGNGVDEAAAGGTDDAAPGGTDDATAGVAAGETVDAETGEVKPDA